jgi:hypothetical protein
MTVTTDQLDVNEVVSNTLISVSQVITQAIGATQLINVQCTKNQKNCNDCVQFWAKKYKSENRDPLAQAIEETCKYACNCSMSDIDLSQKISCDFKNWQSSCTAVDFYNSFMSNLYLSAYQRQETLPGLNDDNKIKAVQEKVSQVYNELTSSTFQSALTSLQATQVVTLKGPGVLTGVNMQQMVKVVSNVLQSSTTVSKLLNELQELMISLTTQVVNAAINQLIASFIMIGLIVVVLFILYIICSNVFLLIPSLIS